jgi:phenylacetate-CoA ligase
MTTTTWASRETLASLLRPTAATGLVQMPSTGDVAVPLAPGGLSEALKIAARHLTAGGLRPTDRVVVALNNDGVDVGSMLALAASHVTEAVVNAGPRGRMRLLRAVNGIGATALVITPTGAMDLLARLHLEFLVDPLDLGIERVVLAGEIPSPGCERQLAMELGARVGTVFCDPFSGIAVGHVEGDRLVADEGRLVTAPLGEDVVAPPEPGEPYELVLRPTWSQSLGEAHLRTGWVVVETAKTAETAGAAEAGAADQNGGTPVGLSRPTATVGDRILARGQWISLRAVTAALRLIDGIEAWTLEVSREGTLDKVRLRVAFNRPSLTGNKMWAGRLRASLAALTPIEIEVDTAADPTTLPDRLVDHRGHHLALDRQAVKSI